MNALMLWAALAAFAGEGDVQVAERSVAAPDRSAPPVVQPALPIPLGVPVVWEVRPGVEAHVVTIPGVRKVSGALWLHRGTLDLDDAPTFAASLTGWLQDVATKQRKATDIEILQDLTDTRISSSAPGMRRMRIALEAPRENLADGLALLAEVLTAPAYPGKDLRQVKQLRHYHYTVEAPSSPRSIASWLVDHAWYPADSPWGVRPDLDALLAVKRADLRRRHARLLDTAPITVMLVGDVTREDVEPLLAEAFAGVGAVGEEGAEPPFEARRGVTVLAVHLPGQDQATVVARTDAPARTHADRLAFEVLNWAVGGHFMSRLNANLREEKGFTYGVGSRMRTFEHHGAWTAQVTVKAENVGATITEIRHEIARVVADGITADEIAAARKEWVGGWNTVQQTSSTAFDFYGRLFEDRQSLESAYAELGAIGALAPADLRDVAARWFADDGPWLWVVVGDRATLEPQLDALGFEVEWVTPQDAVLGRL